MDVLDPKRVTEINLTVTFITGQTVRIRGQFLKGKVEPVLFHVNPRNRSDNARQKTQLRPPHPHHSNKYFTNTLNHKKTYDNYNLKYLLWLLKKQ